MHMPSPAARPGLLVGLACLGLLGASCTGGGGVTEPSPGPQQPSATAQPTQVVNATKDLRDVSCERGDDGWSFDGKVRNRGSQAMVYTVTVRIAPKDNDKSTIGLTTITKQVPAGKTVDFLAKNFSALAKKGNTCIPLATKA